MKKENKLINKINRLIKKAGCPRHLHRFGPKKYEFRDHALALLIKQEGKLGYRRVSNLLSSLGFHVPSYSALAKMSRRVPLALWQKLLQATTQQETHIAALDGTGMSRPLPSPYYYRRIDKPYPVEIPLKLSIAIDTKTKKILALRLRATKAHDIKDTKYLIRRISRKPKKIVADKGYDARWVHEYCHERGIQATIPIREWGKPRAKNMSLRIMAMKKFNKRTYGRREMVESTFSSIKRKFGASVSSVKISAQRAEVYCRAIAHNIIFILLRDFQRSRYNPKPFYILPEKFLL